MIRSKRGKEREIRSKRGKERARYAERGEKTEERKRQIGIKSGNYGILLGIRITVFCQGSVDHDAKKKHKMRT